MVGSLDVGSPPILDERQQDTLVLGQTFKRGIAVRPSLRDADLLHSPIREYGGWPRVDGRFTCGPGRYAHCITQVSNAVGIASVCRCCVRAAARGRRAIVDPD